jgi:ferredoxin-NADP reductase
MALEKWNTAKVINIIDETENTKRFFFRVPELEIFSFKPGQFVTFDLPIHEKKTKRWRSYSIATPPNGSNEFELVIVYAPGGAGTMYLWNEIKVGSEILFKGPIGVFTLPNEIDHDLCFICTGTGIAPFRSMLLDLVNHPRPMQNIFLIFGTRYLKDILYGEEMQALQSRLSNFHFITTLSRENSIEYTGRKGYVHQVYDELFADKHPAHFYLCGWRRMVDEAKHRIISMGYDYKFIHEELYG